MAFRDRLKGIVSAVKKVLPRRKRKETASPAPKPSVAPPVAPPVPEKTGGVTDWAQKARDAHALTQQLGVEHEHDIEDMIREMGARGAYNIAAGQLAATTEYVNAKTFDQVGPERWAAQVEIVARELGQEPRTETMRGRTGPWLIASDYFGWFFYHGNKNL